MKYYRFKDNKLEIITTDYEVKTDGWIYYEEESKPKELFDLLNSKAVEQETMVRVYEAQIFLSDTDFYYARLQETGEEVPVEIAEKRKELREFIRANKEEV